MEENLGNPRSVAASPARSPAKTATTSSAGPPSASAANSATATGSVTTPRQRVTLHTTRKRRLRAQRHAGTLQPANHQQQSATTATTADMVTVPQTTTPRSVDALDAVRAAEKERLYAESKEELMSGRRLLAKNQLQRGNLLPEATGPKKRGSRDGNYRCLH